MHRAQESQALYKFVSGSEGLSRACDQYHPRRFRKGVRSVESRDRGRLSRAWQYQDGRSCQLRKGGHELRLPKFLTADNADDTDLPLSGFRSVSSALSAVKILQRSDC